VGVVVGVLGDGTVGVAVGIVSDPGEGSGRVASPHAERATTRQIASDRVCLLITRGAPDARRQNLSAYSVSPLPARDRAVLARATSIAPHRSSASMRVKSANRAVELERVLCLSRVDRALGRAAPWVVVSLQISGNLTLARQRTCGTISICLRVRATESPQRTWLPILGQRSKGDSIKWHLTHNNRAEKV
jgi:hypothetical protein